MTNREAARVGVELPEHVRAAIARMDRDRDWENGCGAMACDRKDYNILRDYITDARAAARVGAEWLPISSAPRDGTPIWVADHFSLRVAFWSGNEMDRTPQADLWVDFNNRRDTIQFTPIQWYPCPPNPKPLAPTLPDAVAGERPAFEHQSDPWRWVPFKEKAP